MARTNPVVTKLASDPNAHTRPLLLSERARDSFLALLNALEVQEDEVILLPSYLGWSPQEGSGVFDPVRASGARFSFYRIQEDLDIDLQELRVRLETEPVRIVLFVHYFGFPSPSSAVGIQFAREQGVCVVEDEAHALFSDWVGGICGRSGDASLFSFHKLLPVQSGGGLSFNPGADPELVKRFENQYRPKEMSLDLASFDFHSISQARLRNARYLLKAMSSFRDFADPPFDRIPEGVVPQTFPVVLKNCDRDQVYRLMNEAGFGVVSLYHTLVDEISARAYPEAHCLSRKVLNLPVHQDVAVEDLENLVLHLREVMTKL